jgi:hypothetical protein
LRNKSWSPAVFGSLDAKQRRDERPKRRQIMETILDRAREAGMAVMLEACMDASIFIA